MNSRERSEAVRREDGSWLLDGQIAITRWSGCSIATIWSRTTTSIPLRLRALAPRRLPVVGETLSWRDLRIEVVDLDGNRIDKLLLTVRPVAPAIDAASQD